jgi:hypothetical protein
MDNKQEVRSQFSLALLASLTVLQMIDIVETVYRGASKGRGLVVSPKGRPSCRSSFDLLTTPPQITPLAIDTRVVLPIIESPLSRLRPETITPCI